MIGLLGPKIQILGVDGFKDLKIKVEETIKVLPIRVRAPLQEF